jgi:selenocysteine-specific elongation factor
VHVIATAGHVDHGKSTLVRALTGTDPDRWEEEKQRGLTIDLGFASTRLPSGETLAFVDVPGHVRFLKNMLAGVGGVEACLFVVAATEGWKPQSEEHLRVLELVGVTHGVVALTMVDLVDEARRRAARHEVAHRLAGSFLESAEVVEIDATSGEVDALGDALDRLVARTPPPEDRGRPRLWVDRSFSAKGAGTVVTGTLALGRVRVGDDLVVLPGGPQVRVRGAQALHEAVHEVEPGSRAALNLSGVRHDEIMRGHVLVQPGRWHETATFDATLEVLASLDHPLSRRGAHVAYLGSGEYPARVRVLGTDEIPPGARGAVRVHLATRLPLVPGDRYVLRDSGRQETIGGGEVLDVDPVLPAPAARPDRSVDRVIAERGWVDVDELERLTGERRQPVAGRWVVAGGDLVAAEDQLRAAIEAAGSLGLDVAALDDRARAVLPRLCDITVAGGRAHRGGSPQQLDHHPYLDELRSRPFEPPPPQGVRRDELRELVRQGRVVEEEGVYFAAEAVSDACGVIAELLDAHPDGVTVSQIRAALGTSRKYVLPLLARLDATGRTRRRGDLRIAGPRLRRDADSLDGDD